MAYAFISYVRENQTEVERLRDSLQQFKVDTWLDRDSIEPGSNWRKALSNAIQKGSFFLACFSQESINKPQSYMEEEIRLAIKELNSTIIKKQWFIPIRFSECDIPSLPLSDGRDIRDIQWIDMFPDWDSGMRLLINAIRPQWLVEKEKEIRRMRLIEGCKIHVQSKIAWFSAQRAFRVREIEDRWLGLLEPGTLESWIEPTLDLFSRAVSANHPMTERIVEPTETGRVIYISADPSWNEANFLRELPQPHNNSYTSFVIAQRRDMRTLPRWQDRDMVHWIFRQQSRHGEMEIDLLYIINFNLYLGVCAYQLYMSESKKENQMPIEDIYPTSLITVYDAQQMWSAILQQDAHDNQNNI